MPLPEIATAFATVVGLLADFSSQRRARSDADYSDFVAWLAETRHHDVVRLLEQNATTATSIKALLSQDRAKLHDKLEHLDKSLALLAQGMDGLRQLAETVRPATKLSRQALRILREFDASRAGKALDVQTISSRGLILFEGGDGEIKFDDARFADDDLNTLLELGLLRLEYNSRGDRLYLFTRYAAEFLKTLASDA